MLRLLEIIYATSVMIEGLAIDVQHIADTGAAFVAVKTNGSVVAWGYAAHGGNSTAVREALASDVRHIAANSATGRGSIGSPARGLWLPQLQPLSFILRRRLILNTPAWSSWTPVS